MRIHDVLAAKSSQEVVTIAPDATVRELIGLLAEHNIGAVVVSGDGTTVAGIVSERDVVRRLHDGDRTLDAEVSSIMSTEVRTCTDRAPLLEVMQTMTEHRFRHLPVVNGDALTGIVSIGDVVKARMRELEFERDQLGSYVQSAGT